MKLWNRYVKFGVLLAVIAAHTLPSFGYYTATVDGITWTYTVSGGTASLGNESSVRTAVPTSTSGAITIPSTLGGYPVTSIGGSAFHDCRSLTSVTIGNGVTNIGHSAFSSCSGLTSVTIPNSVTSIGGSAFGLCRGLTSVTIPDSVTSIGGSAFKFCTNLTSVTIGNGVTNIGDSAFSSCSRLTSVTIPNSVTGIAGYAFSGCSGLTSVTIGNSVTSIGNSAFRDCSGLTSVTIPNSVTNIAGYAFSGCSGLMSFVVGSGNANYSSANGLLLSKDGKNLICGVNGNVTIPDNVTIIWQGAFYGCTNLTSVTIPDSVTAIGGNAFSECSGLKDVTVPQYVCTNRMSSVFSSAYHSITNVVILDGVTSIGNQAFQDCSGLTSVTIPAGVTSIGRSAFAGCSGLTSVTIPNSVTGIGDSAFYDCRRLTSVTIPNSVTSIGNHAFYDCSGLTSVTIPDAVTNLNLSSTAFDGCGKLWTAWYRTLANASAAGGMPSGGGGLGGSAHVELTVTNVVVHYVTASVPSSAVTVPAVSGIVNVISEVNAGAAVAVTASWAEQYPDFTTKFGSDFTAAVTKPTGKMDCAGRPMMVWQDFVAGTDPTDPDDMFRASITFDKATSKPIISWTPELSPAEVAKRIYRIFGKVRLNDAEWTEIDGDAENYNFFKVTVEMR